MFKKKNFKAKVYKQKVIIPNGPSMSIYSTFFLEGSI